MSRVVVGARSGRVDHHDLGVAQLLGEPLGGYRDRHGLGGCARRERGRDHGGDCDCGKKRATLRQGRAHEEAPG